MKPDVSLVMPSRMAESLGVAGAANTNTTNTLTPTTLKNITQLLESDDCLSNLKNLDETGGFIPPPVVVVTSDNNSKIAKTQTFVNQSWQGGTTTVVTPSKVIAPLTAFVQDIKEEQEEDQENMSVDHVFPSATRRSTRLANNGSARVVITTSHKPSSPKSKSPAKPKRSGGRKPANSRADESLSPEEEERVKVRRLRNKEAAARCRKRRVDLTNSLLKEVESHEAKKQLLEEEIQMLKGQKEELEFILEAHRAHCQLGVMMAPQQTKNNNNNLPVAVKSEPVLVESINSSYVVPERVLMKEDEEEEIEEPTALLRRPASLSIPLKSLPKEVQAGVVIETPTSNMPCLAFESVTTGLTPCGPVANFVAPMFTPTLNTPTLNTPTNCSSQQRSSEVSTSSDLASNSPDFVTL